MAKQSTTPVAMNFKDVPKEAVARAQAAMAGGRQDPLTPAADAKVSEDQKNSKTYTRWTEKLSIVSASRAPSKTGLMEILVVAKIRQSSVKANTGRKLFSRFYQNLGESISEGHEIMNDRTLGALSSLLAAAGLMPTTGGLKGSLLDRMFPLKNQPNAASPLAGKAVIGNVVQEEGPAKDKNGKPKLDEEGEPIMEKRDRAESFLPDTDEAGEDEE